MADKFYDGVIIGGGPAGLAAAIYLARARYRVLVIEKETIGGQITITSEVVNYPGVLHTDGKKLTEEMRKQAQNFGAEFLKAQVTSLALEGDKKKILTDKGEIQALGVVLATGASPRQAGFKGEEEFRGRGVAYCATCDGEFFTGKHVFVIGGGFAAAEEAMFLTKYAKKVTILVRGDAFGCAESVVQEVMENPDIEVKFNTEIKEVKGEGYLTHALLCENKTKEMYRYEDENGFGVFVFTGYAPANELFKDQLELDERGYLVTDRSQRTSLEGVYGAGDICIKELRQVVTAVADGAVAATSMEKYVYAKHRKYGIKRKKLKKSEVKETRKDIKGRGQEEGFITKEMKETLQPVFEKFEKDIRIKLYMDDSVLAGEIRGFAKEFEHLYEKVHFEEQKGGEGYCFPAMVLCDADGRDLNVQFHAVPGGHEFNSFIIALYNAAGPGQMLDEEIKREIQKIQKKVSMKIMVSLSCTMCPELVMAAQRIALLNENITAEMYDLAHFPDLKEKYQIMSVPCMIVNDEKVYFGKKGILELVSILKEI